MILILFPGHFFGEAKGGRQEIKNCCPRRGITTQMTGDFFRKKSAKSFGKMLSNSENERRHRLLGIKKWLKHLLQPPMLFLEEKFSQQMNYSPFFAASFSFNLAVALATIWLFKAESSWMSPRVVFSSAGIASISCFLEAFFSSFGAAAS